jgi:hypothetical protein
MAREIHVETDGDDDRGDGSPARPWRTLMRALRALPSSLEEAVTVAVASGVYAEPILVDRFVGHPSCPLRIVGGTFTGATEAGEGFAIAHVLGPVRVELIDVRFEGDGSQQHALLAEQSARARIENLRVRSTGGAFSRAVLARDRGSLELSGDVHIEGFQTDGLAAFLDSSIDYTGPGALTIVGGDSSAWGVHLFAHSRFITYTRDVHIRITNVRCGFQLGLSSLFQHLGKAGTITIENSARAKRSIAIQGTDLSSWSTDQRLAIRGFTYGFDVNSISYAEAIGPREFADVGTLARAIQNSAVKLP